MTTLAPEQAFTIAHLPYGVVSTPGSPAPRLATAYKAHAVLISALEDQGVFNSLSPHLPTGFSVVPTWNLVAAQPSSIRSQFRKQLQAWLSKYGDHQTSEESKKALIPLSEVKLHYPMETRNFSDFYCSYEHTKNCMDVASALASSPLPIHPNWFTQPSVYNGRTSSLVISGTPITRPCGIYAPRPSAGNTAPKPVFGPEPLLDFELEFGVWLGTPVPRGQRLDIAAAKEHIFGFTLLNDWSSRGLQFFEMPPLGPFHGKGSQTSVSAWITPVEALEEAGAWCASRRDERSVQETKAKVGGVFPHLRWRGGEEETWDVECRVSIVRDGKVYVHGESNLNELHWTPIQQLTHLSVAGEGLSPGDVFGTGTASSARFNAAGEKNGLCCIWERNLSSTKLSTLPKDITQTMLKDGDEVVMEAWCRDKSTGNILLAFGECRGKVLPAIAPREHEQ